MPDTDADLERFAASSQLAGDLVRLARASTTLTAGPGGWLRLATILHGILDPQAPHVLASTARHIAFLADHLERAAAATPRVGPSSPLRT